LDAYKKLKTKPDVTMVDGQGIAHPRRLGIATHLGLVLDIPTIGCGKSRLYGVGDVPADESGSVTYLHDPKDKEIIGAYLRTKERANPVIISPGNHITLEESLEIAGVCVRGYRIPEPTRKAHEIVNMFRRGEIE
jgi:deoxyribonuclease V